MTPEQLIAEQTKELEKLRQEVETLVEHLKDFEFIAQTWKKSYLDLDAKYKRDLGNAQQYIDQLVKDALEEAERKPGW